MLKIRLARGGAKKRPYYSIVVADSHSPRDGRFIEKVGAYNPLLKHDDPKRITLKSERITEWLSKGAQPTDRVARFLSTEGLAKWAPVQQPEEGRAARQGQGTAPNPAPSAPPPGRRRAGTAKPRRPRSRPGSRRRSRRGHRGRRR